MAVTPQRPTAVYIGPPLRSIPIPGIRDRGVRDRRGSRDSRLGAGSRSGLGRGGRQPAATLSTSGLRLQARSMSDFADGGGSGGGEVQQWNRRLRGGGVIPGGIEEGGGGGFHRGSIGGGGIHGQSTGSGGFYRGSIRGGGIRVGGSIGGGGIGAGGNIGGGIGAGGSDIGGGGIMTGGRRVLTPKQSNDKVMVDSNSITKLTNLLEQVKNISAQQAAMQQENTSPFPHPDYKETRQAMQELHTNPMTALDTYNYGKSAQDFVRARDRIRGWARPNTTPPVKQYATYSPYKLRSWPGMTTPGAEIDPHEEEAEETEEEEVSPVRPTIRTMTRKTTTPKWQREYDVPVRKYRRRDKSS